VRTIKFCSVVFGVTWRLSVINTIHWCVARRRLLIAGDGRRVSATTYNPPSKCWRHAAVQQWSIPKPDIGRKSRSLPQLVGPVGILPQRLVWKSRTVWLPDVEIFFKDKIYKRERQQDDRLTQWQQPQVSSHVPAWDRRPVTETSICWTPICRGWSKSMQQSIYNTASD